MQDVLICALGVDITISDLLEMSDNELMRLPGVGKIVLVQLKEMLKDIQDGKFASKTTTTSSVLKEGQFADEYEISLDQLERDIIHGIENFVNSLDEINLYVFVNRYGWKTSQITLEETGNGIPGSTVTKERVRQRQVKLRRDFIKKFPVQSKLLWVKVREN